MALAFGPDETRLPPFARSSVAEVQPLQSGHYSNLLQSSTRLTLGLVILAVKSASEQSESSQGGDYPSFPPPTKLFFLHHSCNPAVQSLKPSSWECGSSLAT